MLLKLSLRVAAVVTVLHFVVTAVKKVQLARVPCSLQGKMGLYLASCFLRGVAQCTVDHARVG